MDEKVDVCHVLNTVRGTSTVVDIANEQRRTEQIGSVGVLAWSDAQPFNTDDYLNIHSIGVPNNVLHITRSQYKTAKSILSEYDIIHTHRNHSGFYAKLIAKRLAKPIVVTHHNNHAGFSLKGRIANGVTNMIADEVVCVSESVQDSFAWWERMFSPDHKLSVIHNGVDVDRLEAAKHLEWSIHDVVEIDPEAIIVGSAGMLTEQKAHEILIEAVDQANESSDQPIELVISGDGELREKLERQIRNADNSDRLHLLGFLDERDMVYKMMHEIDIYAMPSRWEGFCVAALEAMAVGNACVFSNIEEFYKPFKNIALYHTVNDVEDLCKQLMLLIQDDRLCENTASRASKLVRDEYTLKKTADQYAQKYAKLLSTVQP